MNTAERGSHDDQTLRHQHGFPAPLSGTGGCYRAQAVEAFFDMIKSELLWQRSWPTRRAAGLNFGRRRDRS